MKINIEPLREDTRVFGINPNIKVKDIRFQNRYSFMVAGNLYLPENFNSEKKYSAIIISGPFGAVKEQSSGLYAQALAERGFVALAFDQSTTGESSGEIRNIASPDIFVEDFSAAVDFLGTQKYIDREKIGAIGICGLGSHVLTAASIDIRIKAVATSVMYDISEVMWSGFNNSMTEEQRNEQKQQLSQKRWANEAPANKFFPDELPTDADPITTEFFNYYKKRAFHPRSINSNSTWNVISPWGYYNFALQKQIEKIAVPKLIVTGEKAHSRYMAEDAYKRLTSPKELVLVPNATHTDLYDQIDKIPFDKFKDFFKLNFNY